MKITSIFIAIGFLLNFTVTTSETFASNPDFDKVSELFDHAIHTPRETIGTICENHWALNARITTERTDPAPVLKIGEFCQFTRNPVTGKQEVSQKSRLMIVKDNGQKTPIPWFSTSNETYNISKDLKRWTASAQLIISRGERLRLGLTRQQARALTRKATCTVTRAPLALICREDYDPLVKQLPNYKTLYKH